nr:unnamed protein product [Callosobruchus analis]
MTVGNVKFLDSLNYFNMALSKLPTAFGFADLSKGYFPHLFNCSVNKNYVGPIPALEYYDRDNLKDEKTRNEMLKWHSKMVAQNYVFDFQKEILQYCISDVDILTQSCLKFREMLMAKTGVCPFMEATTIASALLLAEGGQEDVVLWYQESFEKLNADDLLETITTQVNSSDSDLDKPITSADYEELLREMEDRNSRKQNIIIYNLPETPNLSKEEQAAADSQHVKRILGNLSNDITILDKPMRLGNPLDWFEVLNPFARKANRETRKLASINIVLHSVRDKIRLDVLDTNKVFTAIHITALQKS